MPFVFQPSINQQISFLPGMLNSEGQSPL